MGLKEIQAKEKDSFNINALQQIGIGTSSIEETWEWYNKYMGFDIPMVLNAEGEASDMSRFTGNEVHRRIATIALNSLGGAGCEFWQYTNRSPIPIENEVYLGDLGINFCKLKTYNIEKAFSHCCTYIKPNVLTEVEIDKHTNEKYFYIKDNQHLYFQIIEDNQFFILNSDHALGGIKGVVIGVSNLEASKKFYQSVLNYDQIIDEETGEISNYNSLPGAKNNKFHRVRLTKSKKNQGPFSNCLGSHEIELVEVITRKPKNIFSNRYWGDPGFIHVCYDVSNLNKLKEYFVDIGINTVAESKKTLDMAESSGDFFYIQDPDDLLIEFVEVKKIPLSKRLGLCIKLDKYAKKPIPDVILKFIFRLVRKKPSNK